MASNNNNGQPQEAPPHSHSSTTSADDPPPLPSSESRQITAPLPNPTPPPPSPPCPPPSESTSRALVPFTGSFPAIAFSFPCDTTKPVIAIAKSSTLDADPEPDDEKKPDSKEHKKRSKNWTRLETLTLIRLRSELAPRFAKAGRKSDLWDEIAEALQKDHFRRDAQQCRDKWEKLMAGYKEVSDGIKHREDNPYYDELYPLLSGRSLKRERERQEATVESPSVDIATATGKEEPFKILAMDGHHHHQPFKTLAMDGHHQQPFKSLAMDGHRQHPFKTLATDGHHHQPFRTLAVDGHATANDEDEAAEERGHLRKHRKGSKFVSATDFHAVQTLLESIIAKQQRFFKELLDAIEKKEQLREQMRQEREEKWRAEERAQRLVFTDAMQILTQKLGGSDRVVVPPTTAAADPLAAISAPPICSPAAHPGPKRRSKNWKRTEVLELIKLRGEMEDKFVKSMRRAALWGELAETLGTQGIRRDGKQCREKWDKLMSEYKDVLDGKKEKGDSPYFPELQTAMAGGRPGEAG